MLQVSRDHHIIQRYFEMLNTWSSQSYDNYNFTLQQSTESGTPLSATGSAKVLCYYTVGPAQQVGGFGWGTGLMEWYR